MVLILIFIFLIIGCAIVASIKQNNPKEKEYKCESTLYIPPRIAYFLKLGGFYEYVLTWVDDIIYHAGSDPSCAHIGKHPRIVEISICQYRSPIWQEINELNKAGVLVHEAAHHEAWERWRDDSEKHAERMQKKFLKRLSNLLKGKPYTIKVPGEAGAIASICPNNPYEPCV